MTGGDGGGGEDGRVGVDEFWHDDGVGEGNFGKLPRALNLQIVRPEKPFSRRREYLNSKECKFNLFHAWRPLLMKCILSGIKS